MIVSEITIRLVKQGIDKESSPEEKILTFNRETYTWKCNEGFWPRELEFLVKVIEAIRYYNGSSDGKGNDQRRT